jgi:DNA-binding response OmpR family regulator
LGIVAPRLLLIDDDQTLADLLAQYLGRNGCTVVTASSAESAIRMLQADNQFDLAVMDIMMPGMTGLELLPVIRSSWHIPVIMLTGRGEDIDRILGLEMGADDYLGKPCNPRELLARIRAVLRRSDETPSNQASSVVEMHGIRIDRGARRASIGETVLQLTTAEFEVLNELMQNAGNVVSREDLTRKVLHRELTPYDRSIDVHVSRVRTALRPGFGDRDMIVTVRGVGYQFIS